MKERGKEKEDRKAGREGRREGTEREESESTPGHICQICPVGFTSSLGDELAAACSNLCHTLTAT